MRYQEQTAHRDHDVVRLYRQASKFHWNRWLRILDPKQGETDSGYAEAKEMLERAMRAGCPGEVIAGIYRVTARTIFGDGDPINQFIALMDVQPFFAQMSAGGKRTFSRHALSARLRDPDLVDELIGPEPEIDDVESRHQQIAQGENADFQSSDVAITVGSTDNHIIHAGEHTIFVEDTIAQVDEGVIPPEEGFRTLSRARAHIPPHLEALAQDEFFTEEFRDLTNRWGRVENKLRQLGQQLEAKREAERQKQLEELRNPRPSVKDIEVAKTEEVKRQTMLSKNEAEIDAMQRKADAEIEVARKQAVVNGEIMKLKELDVAKG
jgi:hypothetical protein